MSYSFRAETRLDVAGPILSYWYLAPRKQHGQRRIYDTIEAAMEAHQLEGNPPQHVCHHADIASATIQLNSRSI
jgi:hypothetical protein